MSLDMEKEPSISKSSPQAGVVQDPEKIIEGTLEDYEVFKQTNEGVNFRTVGWLRASVIFLKVGPFLSVTTVLSNLSQGHLRDWCPFYPDSHVLARSGRRRAQRHRLECTEHVHCNGSGRLQEQPPWMPLNRRHGACCWRRGRKRDMWWTVHHCLRLVRRIRHRRRRNWSQRSISSCRMHSMVVISGDCGGSGYCQCEKIPPDWLADMGWLCQYLHGCSDRRHFCHYA